MLAQVLSENEGEFPLLDRTLRVVRNVSLTNNTNAYAFISTDWTKVIRVRREEKLDKFLQGAEIHRLLYQHFPDKVPIFYGVYDFNPLPWKFEVHPKKEVDLAGSIAHVIEYIPGTPLSYSRLKENRISSEIQDRIDEDLELFYQQGFIPGDLHYGNILLTPQRKIKYIDFDQWTSDRVTSIYQPSSLDQAENRKRLATTLIRNLGLDLLSLQHSPQRKELDEVCERYFSQGYGEQLNRKLFEPQKRFESRHPETVLPK